MGSGLRPSWVSSPFLLTYLRQTTSKYTGSPWGFWNTLTTTQLHFGTAGLRRSQRLNRQKQPGPPGSPTGHRILQSSECTAPGNSTFTPPRHAAHGTARAQVSRSHSRAALGMPRGCSGTGETDPGSSGFSGHAATDCVVPGVGPASSSFFQTRL